MEPFLPHPPATVLFIFKCYCRSAPVEFRQHSPKYTQTYTYSRWILRRKDRFPKILEMPVTEKIERSSRQIILVVKMQKKKKYSRIYIFTGRISFDSVSSRGRKASRRLRTELRYTSTEHLVRPDFKFRLSNGPSRNSESARLVPIRTYTE